MTEEEGYGVYISYVELDQAKQTRKNIANEITHFHGKEYLAASSAKSLNATIRTAVFSELFSTCVYTCCFNFRTAVFSK